MFDIFNSDYVYSDAFWVDEYTLRVVTKRFPHAGEYDVSLALNGQQYDAYFSNAYIVYDDVRFFFFFFRRARTYLLYLLGPHLQLFAEHGPPCWWHERGHQRCLL